jgi:hypothetical protein
MRHGKALLGDKVRYTVKMLMSAVPSQSPCGRQLPPKGSLSCITAYFAFKFVEKGTIK